LNTRAPPKWMYQAWFGRRAQLINPDAVRAIYLVASEPDRYYEYSAF
jgi:hypothetical protein